MKKVSFGTPEKIVPSVFCKKINYVDTDIKYELEKIKFRTTSRGCLVEFPLESDEEVYGFGLQLKGFDHKGRKLCLRTNSDPVAYTGDSHAPVPFFVSTKGYGMYFDTARYAEAYCGYNRKELKRSTGRGNVGLTTDEIYEVRKQNSTSTMLGANTLGMASATSMLNSLVGFVLIVISNRIVKKLDSDGGIF